MYFLIGAFIFCFGLFLANENNRKINKPLSLICIIVGACLFIYSLYFLFLIFIVNFGVEPY